MIYGVVQLARYYLPLRLCLLLRQEVVDLDRAKRGNNLDEPNDSWLILFSVRQSGYSSGLKEWLEASLYPLPTKSTAKPKNRKPKPINQNSFFLSSP